MKIHEFFYSDENRTLLIEFSTKKDADKFYRILELEYGDIEYYSPQIINEDDLNDIDKEFIIELLNQYLSENDLPEERIF